MAEQELDQGGLARPVRTGHSDAVAALDAGGEVLENDPLAPALGDALGLDHPLARLGAGIDAHDHRAALITHIFFAQFAQGHQLATAPLIAGAAGGDAAQHPVIFLLDLLVEAPSLVGLLIGDLFAPLVKSSEALVEAADLAVFQPETALGDPLKKSAVVADDQGGAAAGGQLGLQCLDRENVHMVGRLVEHQHVGLFGKGAGQGGAANFSAR